MGAAVVGGVWVPHTSPPPRLTLHQDFAQGAGIACSTGCKAHVLAGVNTRQVVQDKGARAIRIFYEDVVRVHLYWLPIWKGGRTVTEEPIGTGGRAWLEVTVTSSDGGVEAEAQGPGEAPCWESSWPS